MILFDFDTLFQKLKSGVETTAQQALSSYVAQAKTDGTQALADIKDNLQRWTQELANGQLTIDDFSFLLQEQTDLEKMTALKQEGIAQIQIDTFRNNLISMIVGTVSSFLKI